VSVIRLLIDRTIHDPDASVRGTACQLAARAQMWPFLLNVLREASDGKTRASALRALLPTDWLIPAQLLERALTGTEPAERYWACLVARHQKLTNLLPRIRPLVQDQAAVGSTSYFAEMSWPGYDEKVGHLVTNAAHAALSALAPNSAIWRDNVNWQATFEKST
jgi:hypothetical protein